MKRIVFAAAALCSMYVSAETLVGHWDFSKKMDPVKGNFKMVARGKSAIASEGKEVFLRVNGDGKNPAGVITKGVIKALSPAAFRAEITFRLKEGNAPSVNQFLMDSKYVPYPHKAPVHNKGFIVYLVRPSKTVYKFYPTACVGYGTTSQSFHGKAFDLAPGKKCTVSFSWNGKDTAEFKVDGKVNHKEVVKNGAPMAPAHYALAIGDRFSGDYSPVNGDVIEAKLFDLSAAGK